MNYESKVENVSPVSKSVTIRLAAETVRAYLEKEEKEVQRKAELPGFRKGKVPINVVRKKFGGQLRSDALSHLIQDSYRAALNEHKIQAVGDPRIEPGEGWGLVEGSEFSFKATVEVFPEFDVGGLDQLKIRYTPKDLGEKDVKDALEQIRQNHKTMDPNPTYDGPAKAGDFVILNFSGSVAGKANSDLSAENRLFKLGAEMLMPEFEEQVYGLRRGESKDFEITFPKDHPEPKYAGQVGQFRITLVDFKIENVPELDDDLARQVGAEDLADLRKKIIERMNQTHQRAERRRLKEAALTAAMQAVPFAVPETFVHRQVEFLAQETVSNLRRRGVPNQVIEDHIKESHGELKQRAEFQVRATLIIDRIVNDHAIGITDADVDAEVSRLVADDPARSDVVKQALESPQARSELKFHLREEKVVDWILAQAKLVKE